MAETNLPKEEKLSGQYDKNYHKNYMPGSGPDSRIYNYARDGPMVYRNTPGSNSILIQEQIDKYVRFKTFQTILWLVGFLVGLPCLYHGLVDRHYIKVHVFTWFALFRCLGSALAAALLSRGNNKEDIKSLKAFLNIGFFSYSWFDLRTGGYNVVKKRIMEIMSKNDGNPTMA